MDLKKDKKLLQIYFVICLVIAAVIGFTAIYILKMDLRDNKTSQTLFVFCFIVGLTIVLLTYYLFKKKGIVDVYMPKNMIKTGLFAFITIGFLPIWLDPVISVKVKVLIATGSVAVAIANFYSVHYGGRRLRKQIGMETEEDRREIEKEEKARKEKEAKGKHE